MGDRQRFFPLVRSNRRYGLGACIRHIMYDWRWMQENRFLLAWLLFYLTYELHLPLAAMAKIVGFAYFLMAVAATSAGWASDRYISTGKTPTLVRKTFMVVRQVGAGISLVACVVSGPVVSLVSLLLAAFWSISASNTWAITQTLAGPQAAGEWTGLQNFLGNLAGWIAPVVTGLIVDNTGRFLCFHHHRGHGLAGLSVLDIYCRRYSTGGLVNSPGLRGFPLNSKHAARPSDRTRPSVQR